MRITLCFFTTLLICLFGSAAIAAPNLQAKDPKFDFGEVFQGDKVPHIFEFINEGDETLKVDRVRSSCGCTAVLVSDKEIPPGGKGEIQANFDSSRFRGSVAKTIYLYTNDPVRPTMQFHIKGTILETVVVEPAQINFGQVTASKPVTTTVVLRNQGREPLVLGTPTSTAAELLVEMSKTSFASGEEVTLQLKLTPRPGQARFSGYVLVPVDGVPRNELRISVYAAINN